MATINRTHTINGIKYTDETLRKLDMVGLVKMAQEAHNVKVLKAIHSKHNGNFLATKAEYLYDIMGVARVVKPEKITFADLLDEALEDEE